MKKIGIVAAVMLLVIVGAVVVFQAASSGDSSSRKAAIGSSTPVAGGGSIASSSILGGAPIRVDGWSWAIQVNVTVGTGAGAFTAAKPNLSALTVEKNIDNASTTLVKFAANQQTIPTLTFKVGTALTYTLTNVRVSGVEQSGSDSNGTETAEFTYQKITMVNAAAGTSPNVSYDLGTGITG
ncbi:MAG: type VI secretion system tube protein Hcp [Gaiellaceae bacterium]